MKTSKSRVRRTIKNKKIVEMPQKNEITKVQSIIKLSSAQKSEQPKVSFQQNPKVAQDAKKQNEEEGI